MERDDKLDEPLTVTWTHRLRFTRDALAIDNPTLLEVLGPEPAEALIVIDSGVVDATPGILDTIDRYAAASGGRLALRRPHLVMPGGEQAKNNDRHWRSVAERIDRDHLCRKSFVIAIGGGAVLDATGFAAATAHRGLRLVRLPTTTLSQGDSGVGVKNGINAFGKKNFLGSFAPPWAVINDWAFLDSLSDRDWASGFSEAVKVSLVRDADLFETICRHASQIRSRNTSLAEPIIRRSALLHVEHIVRGGDPFELSEARPLDFGHWSAHKLEQLTGFELRHGEAVAIGIALDTTYASLAGIASQELAERVRVCLDQLGLPLYHAAMADTDRLLDGLEEFREHLGGRLTLTLAAEPGTAVDVHEVDRPLMRQAIDQLAQLAAALR